MNKISKKIVALATMAAFVLTLVPAAAFAADPTLPEGDLANSSVKTVLSIPEVEIGEDVVLETSAYTSDNKEAQLTDVMIWAEDAAGNVTKNVKFYDETGKAEWTTNNGVVGPTGAFLVNGQKFIAKFSVDGKYTVHIGKYVQNPLNPTDPTDTELKEIVSNEITVLPNAAETIIASDVTYTGVPDGVTGVSVEATVQDANKNPMYNKEVAIVAPAGFSIEVNGKDATTAVTDRDGKISFTLVPGKDVVEGTYTLKLSCDDGTVSKNILVTVKSTTGDAQTIEVVDTGKDVVAVGETKLGSVAQVVFKDTKGNAVDVVPAQDTTVKKESAPEKYTGTFSLEKMATGDNYQLVASKALVAGEYKVAVALNHKDSAELTFTADKFGEIVSSKIVIVEGSDSTAPAVTKVYDGKTYTGYIYVVDENGLEKLVEDANTIIGMTKGNDAVSSFTAYPVNGGFTFTVEDDVNPNDNALIGTDISFMATNVNAGVISAETTVTVTDAANTEDIELAFDSEAGESAQWNNVGVTVVDANGDILDNVTNSATDVTATVVSKSNEDANVQVNMGKVTKGKGTLKVYSDKETTADILVVVRNGNVIYANTLTYAFGEQDIPVDTTVVMTIGSSDFVINDKVVTKEDSAPYVANDRTYVPFRALGEALGAEVVWDNDARTVTYTLGNTEVVMTIGETTYTVNGDEKTMDVAPEITGDRTYVPVRFVGEALGFKVVALSATDGTTSSVVFQK